jgi:hypothetical protein
MEIITIFVENKKIMKNGENGAFPMVEKDGIMQEGLTKREYFAGLALQGMLANSSLCKTITTTDEIETLCNASILFSDELLKKLEK